MDIRAWELPVDENTLENKSSASIIFLVYRDRSTNIAKPKRNMYTIKTHRLTNAERENVTISDIPVEESVGIFSSGDDEKRNSGTNQCHGQMKRHFFWKETRHSLYCRVNVGREWMTIGLNREGYGTIFKWGRWNGLEV